MKASEFKKLIREEVRRVLTGKTSSFEEFLYEENKTITSKEQLLGKKFYHGTILETWKNQSSDSYLFIVDDFEFAKNSAIDRADNMVREYNKPFTAIVVEIVITDGIIKLDWVEDDDEGAYRDFKHWTDSYNNIGSFAIKGRYDINRFKTVYKQVYK